MPKSFKRVQRYANYFFLTNFSHENLSSVHNFYLRDDLRGLATHLCPCPSTRYRATSYGNNEGSHRPSGFYLSDDPGWIAHGYRVRRYILSDHGPGPNDTPPAYGYTWQQDGATTYPHLVLNSNGPRVRLAPEGRVGMTAVITDRGLGRVCSCVHLDVRCDKHPVADVDTVIVYEGAVHVNDNMVAQMNILTIFAVEVNVNVYVLAHTAQKVVQDAELGLTVSIVAGIILPEQSFGTQAQIRGRTVGRKCLASHTFL